MVDINGFLSSKKSDLHSLTFQEDEMIKELELYNDVKDDNLKYIFASMQNQFNLLFGFMNEKSRTNRNFNADQSRELLKIIEILSELDFYLGKTIFKFTLVSEYKKHIDYSKKFLQYTYGSEIPLDYKEIFIIEYEPIFSINQSVSYDNTSKIVNFPLKSIGEGSYAKVYKYTDTNYNITFAVKKALKTLVPKELDRFEKEYLTMQALDSPYIIKAYSYDENKKEYTMEFADFTIKKYLELNPTLSIEKRKRLSYQIFKAFEYLHSKGKYHRDISFTNVLVKIYEDVEIIKISDFGLVKELTSDLTSRFTEFKGSLNDSNLELEGFANYTIIHETYALTRLIYFVMTNKANISNPKNETQKEFLDKGLHHDKAKRFQSVIELNKNFNNVNW